MIKSDYTYSAIKLKDLKIYESAVLNIVKDFADGSCKGKEFIGWYDYVKKLDLELLGKIENDARDICDKYDTMVVCGIGGSYLGARSVIEAIKGLNRGGVEIIYLGNTFDERYTKDVLDYLDKRNFCVNVISKSGSTLETAVAFRLLKSKLLGKYGEDYKNRIYATTDERSGCLREMADSEGYKSYVIPRNVGGRYSVFTPVGLLPIAVAGINIKAFVKGAKQALDDLNCKEMEGNIAYQYATYRYIQYLRTSKVELFASYSPYLNMLSEWWKQLFGESEGKENKGLFPASAIFSTDLHSLGQFVQEGSKVLFITQLKDINRGNLKIEELKSDIDGLNYLKGVPLDQINLIAQEGTNKAHFAFGGIDNFTFVVDGINESNLGYFMFVMMYSCMISANLLGVNPFDQPGVEYYKKEMKKMLKK